MTPRSITKAGGYMRPVPVPPSAARRVITKRAGYLQPTSILDLTPVWAIDARSGPVDLVGSVDPVPMAGTLLAGAGRVVAVSMLTNEGDPNQSLLFTPDSPANSVGSFDLRWSAGAIDDPSNDGGAPQSYKVAKLRAGEFIPEYGASVLLTGKMHITWFDDSDASRAADVGDLGALDEYDPTPMRATLDATTGVATGYIEDDDDFDDTTADGRHWRIIGTDTPYGPTTVRASTGLLTFLLGKGVGSWCQLYDGIDGTLVVDLDIDRDAPAGLVDGDTFTAGTDETWELGGNCATFEMERASWLTGAVGASADGPFRVPHATALDPGEDDFSVSMVITPTAVPEENGEPVVFAEKADGTIGAGGTGWRLAAFNYPDYGLVGLIFVASDGTELAIAGASSPSLHDPHLVTVTWSRGDVPSITVDGVTTGGAMGADVANVSTTEDLTVRYDNAFGPSLLGAAATWDRALTGPELAQLHALMGVS